MTTTLHLTSCFTRYRFPLLPPSTPGHHRLSWGSCNFPLTSCSSAAAAAALSSWPELSTVPDPLHSHNCFALCHSARWRGAYNPLLCCFLFSPAFTLCTWIRSSEEQAKQAPFPPVVQSAEGVFEWRRLLSSPTNRGKHSRSRYGLVVVTRQRLAKVFTC